MCGRVACTLAADDVCRTCRRTQGNGKWSQPKWKQAPDGGKYYPSYNAAPTNYLPVMVSKKHFEDSKKDPKMETENPAEPEPKTELEEGQELAEGEVPSDFVIQPMKWGLIPPWHSGDTKSAGYNTINARSDTMCDKNTYKRPLEKGRRCVVLCDGYFEWHNKSQPYYIYHPEEGTTVIKTEVKSEDGAEGQNSENTGDSPKKLLTMAGIFDIYRSKNGDPPLYSYSMITVDAHDKMAWLHKRMPAILSTDEEVSRWLNFGEVPLKEAVKLIYPREQVKHHPVSTMVNKVQNKTPDCIKPVNISASKNFMSAWLQKGAKKRKSSEFNEESAGDVKKMKTENESS